MPLSPKLNYRFNGEGNQVSCRCDAKRVTTINFDRNKIRGMATELGRKADEVSAKLDQCIVNTVEWRTCDGRFRCG